MKFFSWLKKNSILTLYLIIASILYFYNLPASFHFAADQGRDAIVMREMLTGKTLKLTGPTTSVGLYYLGPFFYYFTAPSLLLANFNPLGPAVMQALIGVLTVFCLFKYLEKYLNKSTAILATGWYLLLPTFIFYNRFAWNPNPIPLFFVLFAWSLTKFNETKKLKYLTLTSLNFWILLQLHLVTLVLGLPILISLINYCKTNKEFKNLLFILSFLIFDLTAIVPLLIGIIKNLNSNQDKESLINLSQLSQNLVAIVSKSIAELTNNNLFLVITILAMIIFLGFKIIKTKQLPLTLKSIILPSLMANLIGQGLLSAKVETHYLFIFLISSIIVLSYYLTIFLKNKLIILKYFSLFLFVFAIISFYSHWLIIFSKKPTSASSIKTTANLILAKSNNQPFQLAALLNDNGDNAFNYFIELKTNNLKTGNDLADQIFVICATNQPCQPHGQPHWEIAKFEQAHQNQTIEEKFIAENIVQLKVKK